VESAAAREAVSISRWARERLQEAAKRERGKGSLDVFYGCISDASFRAPKELPAAEKHPETSIGVSSRANGGFRLESNLGFSSG